MSSIFEDFGLPDPVLEAPSKPATTIKGGRKDNPGIRRLNPGPYDFREMLLFSVEAGTIRTALVDVNHLQASGTDLQEGGWVNPAYLMPMEEREALQKCFDAVAEALAAYTKVKNFQSSKALFLARQGRASYQRQIEVEKELQA